MVNQYRLVLMADADYHSDGYNDAVLNKYSVWFDEMFLLTFILNDTH